MHSGRLELRDGVPTTQIYTAEPEHYQNAWSVSSLPQHALGTKTSGQRT